MNSFDIILCREEERTRGVALTVDSDGDALGEDKAVSALEGRDLAELVELQVLGGETLGGGGLNELDIEAVLLGDCEEGGGARVTLMAGLADILGCSEKAARGTTYAVAVDLSEGHDCE